MCVESVDLPGQASVDLIRVDAGAELADADGAVTAPGRRVDFEEEPWPYEASAIDPDQGDEIAVPLVPYHNWANRGPSTMRVWIPGL